jgi:tetratricopeptide (TPR) repeat protein
MAQEEQLERVQALIDLGRLDDARRLLIAILAADPNAVAALRLLAVCHFQTGDGEAALDAADRAVAAEPQNEWGHRLRASALLLLGRPRDAIAAARQAIQLEPGNWAGHLLLGLAAAPEHHRLSRAAFRRAAALAPMEPEVPFVRGQMLFALGANRRARRAYRETVRIDPQHAGALEGLAAIAMSEGRLGQSLRYVRSAAAAAPGTVAVADYLDRALVGSLGWAVVTGWILMVVLLFTVMPVAWLVGAGVVAAYFLWLWQALKALPVAVVGVAWARIRSQPRQLARLLIAGATAAVAVGVGVAASRLDVDHFDPIPELVAISVALVGGIAVVIATDRWVAHRQPRAVHAPATAMDMQRPIRAATKRLAFRIFTAALVPAIVLFVPAIDPEPNRLFRAGLGTVLLAGLALVTWWIVRQQRPMSAAGLARWSRVPEVGLSAFWLGWLVLVAFLVAAAYLPDGSPLLVDVLAVGALVAIAYGVLVLVAVVVVASALWVRELLRSLAGPRR